MGKRGKIGSNHILHFNAPYVVARTEVAYMLGEINVHVAVIHDNGVKVDCRPHTGTVRLSAGHIHRITLSDLINVTAEIHGRGIVRNDMTVFIENITLVVNGRNYAAVKPG